MNCVCNVCSKKVFSHCCHMLCSSCKTLIHLKCLPMVDHNDPLYTMRHQDTWICTKCIEATLPFVNIIDEDDYSFTIHDNQMFFVDHCINELNTIRTTF